MHDACIDKCCISAYPENEEEATDFDVLGGNKGDICTHIALTGVGISSYPDISSNEDTDDVVSDTSVSEGSYVYYMGYIHIMCTRSVHGYHLVD